MDELAYTKHEVVSLRGHPQFNEKWVQQIIEEDPAILGLGELEFRQAEKVPPTGGRLDLLLSDPDSERRYEVELMLGPLDESHIIRTLEYWDIERRRFPQHDHCAVIVAEKITSRFINVVQLFNRTVPLIAVQMQALRVGEQVLLHFTTVLDEFEIGGVGEEPPPGADRSYWEKKGSPSTVALADKCLEIIRAFAPQITLKYNKRYVGFVENGVSAKFVTLRPRKKWLLVEVEIENKAQWVSRIEDADLPTFQPAWANHGFLFRVSQRQFSKSRELLSNIFRAAYAGYGPGSATIRAAVDEHEPVSAGVEDSEL